MIEIIALTAALILVVLIAAFAWVSKKRLDKMQDDVFDLIDETYSLRLRLGDIEHATILRKAGEE